MKNDAMPTLKTLTTSMTLTLKVNAVLAKTYINFRKDKVSNNHVMASNN